MRCISHLPLCLSQSSTCNSSTNDYYVSQNHNRCQKLFLWCCLMLSFCSGLSFTIPCIGLHNFNDTEQEQKEKEIWFRPQKPDLYTDKTQLPPPTSLASGLKCKLPASPPSLRNYVQGVCFLFCQLVCNLTKYFSSCSHPQPMQLNSLGAHCRCALLQHR